MNVEHEDYLIEELTEWENIDSQNTIKKLSIEYIIKTKHYLEDRVTIDGIIKDFFKKYSEDEVKLDKIIWGKVKGRVYEIKNILRDVKVFKKELKDLEDILKSKYRDIEIDINFIHNEEKKLII